MNQVIWVDPFIFSDDQNLQYKKQMEDEFMDKPFEFFSIMDFDEALS